MVHFPEINAFNFIDDWTSLSFTQELRDASSDSADGQVTYPSVVGIRDNLSFAGKFKQYSSCVPMNTIQLRVSLYLN